MNVYKDSASDRIAGLEDAAEATNRPRWWNTNKGIGWALFAVFASFAAAMIAISYYHVRQKPAAQLQHEITLSAQTASA